jgi:hypothetical protein
MDGANPKREHERGITGWSRWSNFLGFSVESVLADDWRFVEDQDGR